MKAAIYHSFSKEITIENLPDPTPSTEGVVLKVLASGICRSDWFGWQGYDKDIRLPHVPGHELVGEIVEVGSTVPNWKIGQLVTVPFVGGCGKCPECLEGHQQVCNQQFQPGFTSWGSFADFVAINYAEQNLVELPEEMNPIHASSLGCRFITAFRGMVHQAKVSESDWVAIHGCGGVGLSCIMIAKAFNAKVIAIDIQENKLDRAKSLGADFTINASAVDVDQGIREIRNRGMTISVDALGLPETCLNSINSLAKRGQHIQIGLLEGNTANLSIPMDKVIADELQIKGSHGMQAHKYGEIFELYAQGRLPIEDLISDVVDLNQGIDILQRMDRQPPEGIAVIDMTR